MKNQISFYQLFYGFEFHRHFTRPPDFKSKQFKIQSIVKNPKQLYLNVHQNNGFHPCYVSTYDHGSKDNLNKKDSGTMILDRVYFDFDVDNVEVHQLKKKLQNIRSHGLNYHPEKQIELRDQLQNLIINEHLAEPAINQAKEFSIKFKEYFDSYPILFFSGCKGAHAYTFFNPIKDVDINRALFWFAEKIKVTYQYQTLDLSVNKNAANRLSRVPYSKHQYTGLTVVPFTIEDSYDEIMAKSLSPGIEPFTQDAYHSSFGEYLQKIDPILEHNEKVKEAERVATRGNLYKPQNAVVADHRLFFKSILGEPEREYPDKEYVMYKCPFPGHDDNKPSFRVHKTGYYCYGCQRKGNYFQFLKDYYELSNEEVKAHLKSKMEAC